MEITDIQLTNDITNVLADIDSEIFCYLMDNDVDPGQAYDIVYAPTGADERVNYEISLEELLLCGDDAVL